MLSDETEEVPLGDFLFPTDSFLVAAMTRIGKDPSRSYANLF